MDLVAEWPRVILSVIYYSQRDTAARITVNPVATHADAAGERRIAMDQIWVKSTDWNATVPRGNGRCYFCGGEGWITCVNCKCDGVCPECSGTGIMRGGYHCADCDSNRVAGSVTYSRAQRYIMH